MMSTGMYYLSTANGDCYGCYNPFRAVNGLPMNKDPFFFGNLLSQSFEQITAERKGFKPVMDVSKPYWRPCLLCEAVEIPRIKRRKVMPNELI